MRARNDGRRRRHECAIRRVLPTMNLSVEDVRGYLTAQLDRLGNKRLKIGNVNADGGFITAYIATVDNSRATHESQSQHRRYRVRKLTLMPAPAAGRGPVPRQ